MSEYQGRSLDEAGADIKKAKAQIRELTEQIDRERSANATLSQELEVGFLICLPSDHLVSRLEKISTPRWVAARRLYVPYM